MIKFSVGDRVLFSGETLTVVGLDGDRVVCQWFTTEMELRSAALPAAALHPARRGPSRANDFPPMRVFGSKPDRAEPDWPADP